MKNFLFILVWFVEFTSIFIIISIGYSSTINIEESNIFFNMYASFFTIRVLRIVIKYFWIKIDFDMKKEDI